jgi:hypothetical protein
MASRRLNVEVTGDSSSVQRAFKQAGRSADEFNAKAKTSERSLKSLDTAFARSSSQVHALGDAVKTLKFPALIAGTGVAAQALSNLGAGAVAVTSSLAPLSGALAAYPALGSAAAQGIGVFKLATSNVFEAVGGLNEQLDKNSKAFKRLSPEAQRLAVQLDRMKKPLQDLSLQAQHNMFPGLISGVKEASRNLPVLQKIVRETAKELGGLGERAGHLLGSKAFGRDLALQGERNVKWMRDGGQIAFNLADALRNVTIAAGPLVNWMVKLAVKASEWVKAQADAGRESGKLATFFDHTRIAMSRVIRIGVDLTAAFFNIGKAARPLGDDILKSLVRSADAFRKWTDSAKGKNAIADYFRQARPAVFELGRLVRDIGGAFLRLGQGQMVAPLLRQIRTTIIPAFEKVATTTTASLGPPLIKALGQVADLFGHLAGSSGPLVAFVNVLTQGLKLANKILDTFPALNTAVVALAGLGGLAKALKLTAAITGISKLRGLIKVTAVESAAIGGVSAVGGGVAAAGGAAASGGLKNTIRGAGAGALAAVGGVAGVGALAVGGAALYGLSQRSQWKDADKLYGRLQDIYRQLNKMGATNGMRQLDAQLRRLPDQATDWSDAQKQAISSFADATLAAARRVQSTRKAYQSVEDSIKSLATTAGRRMADIKTDVLLNMRQIEHALGSNSAQGKREVAKNFNAAADAVRLAMHAGTVSTREGTAQISRYLRQALAVYGITGQAATNYIHSPIGDLQGKPAGGSVAKNPGGSDFQVGVGHAGGGWIGARGMRGQDTVPVLLGAGEAVLNRHQQGVVEGMLGQGFLDRLFARVQTPHYMAKGGYVPQPQMALASGGRIPPVTVRGDLGAVSGLAQGAVNVDRSAAQRVLTQALSTVGDAMSGAVSASGLVPQVKRALAWARSHGWSGSVTSGLRSTAKQQYLWDHAAQLGLVRGVSVARPGSSEHERGRAVDVSDIGGFQHAMASAPANARLLWRGPSDPVHFSVSGHARGGFIRRMARGGRAWTHSELAKLWVQAGGPASVSDVAAAVAQAESSGKPGASSHNPVSGGTNVGLWQIDNGSHSGASSSPFANAKAAVSIWRAAGQTFRKDWEAYTNGSYRQFLSGSNVGKSAAANLGGGGISVRQGFVTQHGGLAFAPLTVGLHGKAPAGLGPGPVSRANAMIARAQMPTPTRKTR